MPIAPEETQIEDMIYIVLENETPFLLRKKTNGTYYFVGECYIHGIMDGDYAENDRAEFVAMLIHAAQNETLEQQFANSFSKKEFSSAADYFLHGYKVASQGIRNLMTLSAVPIACKAFFATVKAILGLKRKVN